MTTFNERDIVMTTATTQPAAAHRAAAASSRGRSTLLHYIGQSIAIQLRDWAFIGFILVMPVTVYLFFANVFGNQPTNTGYNVAAFMMITMGTYGGLGAAMNAGSQIQSERSSGWFRQLMLTALTPTQFVLAKIVTAVSLVIPAIGAVFIAGVIMGVRLEPGTWALAMLLIVAALLPMVVMGLVIGLWFKPQTATAVTTLTMIALAMLGGLWFPLNMMPAAMQAIGRLTPSYWASEIGTWPLLGGAFPWQGVAVLGCWLALLAGLGALGYRRAVRSSRR